MDRITPGYVPDPSELRPRRRQGRPAALDTETKAAGVLFRTAAQAMLDDLNAVEPVQHKAPPLLALFRHVCSHKNNTSVAIQLQERFIQSDVPLPEFGWTPEQALALGGLLAFIFKEGVCRRCGESARSVTGRVVLTAERPPTAGRLAR